MHHVLVVDDEVITADTLGLIFRRRGFVTQVVYDVDAALKSVLQSPPQLILCDISMPGRDGLELMVELTRMQTPCSLIVLTGYSINLPPVHEQFLKMSQKTHVFTKPCSPEDLLRKAETMLSTT